MEVRDRIIKRSNYYIQLVLFILHVGFIIYMIITYKDYLYQFLFSIAIWSFILSTFYLISILICDTLLYFFGLKNLEKFNHFIRNPFSSIVFPYCFIINRVFVIIIIKNFF